MIGLAIYTNSPIEPIFPIMIGYGILVFFVTSIFEGYYWDSKIKPTIPPYYGDRDQVVAGVESKPFDEQPTSTMLEQPGAPILPDAQNVQLIRVFEIAKQRGLYSTRRDPDNPGTQIVRLRCPSCNYVYDVSDETLQDGMPFCPSCSRPFAKL